MSYPNQQDLSSIRDKSLRLLDLSSDIIHYVEDRLNNPIPTNEEEKEEIRADLLERLYVAEILVRDAIRKAL